METINDTFAFFNALRIGDIAKIGDEQGNTLLEVETTILTQTPNKISLILIGKIISEGRLLHKDKFSYELKGNEKVLEILRSVKY